MSRIFFAIPIERQQLAFIQPQLTEQQQRLGKNVIWTPIINWHITVRFLGDVNHKQLTTMVEAAREIARETPPMILQIKKLGSFPTMASRTLALHVQSDPELKSLSDKLEGAAIAVGLNRDPRRFRPHITLGKFIDEDIRIDSQTFDRFDIAVKELVLYASKTQEGSNEYKKLQTFKLQLGIRE